MDRTCPIASTQGTPEPAPALRSKQLLFYTPSGPLGGWFTCSRCGAAAWQPDLIGHASGCAYGGPAPGAGPLPR